MSFKGNSINALKRKLQGINIITLCFDLNDAITSCSKGASWLHAYWLSWLERLLFITFSCQHFTSYGLALCTITVSISFSCFCFHLWWLHLNSSREKLTYIPGQDGKSWLVLFKSHPPHKETVCFIWKSFER